MRRSRLWIVLAIAASFGGGAAFEHHRDLELSDARRRTHEAEREATTLAEYLAQANKRREVAEGQVSRLIQLNAETQKNLGDLRRHHAACTKRLHTQGTDWGVEDERDLIARAEDKSYERLRPRSPVPAIDGKVAAVKDDVSPPLVLLSVGSDDKVEKGYHFCIYRGSEFIAKVVVEKVLRDSCGARVLFTKEGARVQPGDDAVTRFQ